MQILHVWLPEFKWTQPPELRPRPYPASPRRLGSIPGLPSSRLVRIWPIRKDFLVPPLSRRKACPRSSNNTEGHLCFCAFSLVQLASRYGSTRENPMLHQCPLVASGSHVLTHSETYWVEVQSTIFARFCLLLYTSAEDLIHTPGQCTRLRPTRRCFLPR